MDKNKIKYSITAHIPRSVCNMRCNYCYVTQAIDEDHNEKETYRYPVETMIEAFSPKRLGGIAEFTVMSCGETLLDNTIVPFVHGLLKQGHVVTVVTNMTLNKKVDELLDIESDCLGRLVVKGSLHWLELKRLNKVDDFFNNMNKILNKGASAFPSVVICDDYMPYLDEIRQTCLDKIGELPIISPCQILDEMKEGGVYKASPECTPAFIKEMDEKFKCKLFGLSARVLKMNINKIFCYAGKWSFEVDIGDGYLRKCHNCPAEYNFFEKLDEMPKLEAIGVNCQIPTCAFQHNFLAEGLLPEINGIETLPNMYERPKLFNPTIRKMLDFKFTDFEKQYSKSKQEKVNEEVKNLFHNIRYHGLNYKKTGLKFKDKIRLKIYNQLKKTLTRKGIV